MQRTIFIKEIKMNNRKYRHMNDLKWQSDKGIIIATIVSQLNEKKCFLFISYVIAFLYDFSNHLYFNFQSNLSVRFTLGCFGGGGAALAPFGTSYWMKR